MKNNLISDKAQYLLGDQIVLTIPGRHNQSESVKVNLYKLYQLVTSDYQFKYVSNQEGEYDLQITIKSMPLGNYGVEIVIESEIYTSAFDVVKSNRDYTRYGFLSDFSETDNDTEDVDYINRLHLNAVQFYDWMYKHEDLVSKDDIYTDPLGRLTDLRVIKKKIARCIELGIRPFAYGAVYAASRELFNEHPEWGLYTAAKEPITFFNWLNFMNISETSGWSDLIINQFAIAIKEMHFQGIHMDTYGFPKVVCDFDGNTFSLADAFPGLINRASAEVKKNDVNSGVIFNCVNNWPIEKVALTNQDAIYIEVWPPHETYFDLYQLIKEAKIMSHKPVILAAYVHPFKNAKTAEEIKQAENALLLANAVINASGGTQLVHGEKAGILCDSYYAKYAVSSEGFKSKIINYADYLVRYADLLYQDQGSDISMTSASGINEDICFRSRSVSFSSKGETNKVWTIIRESDKKISIQLLNLTNNNSFWNQAKNDFIEINDITIGIKTNRNVTGIYCASPDYLMKAISMDYEIKHTDRGHEYIAKIPNLLIWNTVWIEME